MLYRVDPALHQDAVEDERLLVRAGRRQHHGAAAQIERPGSTRILRRLGLRHQRQSRGAGDDLERHCQHAPGGVPIELHFGTVDRDHRLRIADVDERSRPHQDAAGGELRRSVLSKLGTKHGRYGRIGLDLAAVDAQCQQQVFEQNLARLQIDRAGAIAAGLDRCEHEPRPG